MEYLFTNGVKAQVVEGKIILITGINIINTELSNSVKSLVKIQDKYGMKLIGTRQNRNANKYEKESYIFTLIVENTLFKYEAISYSLSSSFIELYDLININVFGTLDNYYDGIANTPVFLETEGHKQELYMSKDFFQKALDSTSKLLMIKEEFRNKYMYIFDIHAMIDDLQSAIFSIIPMFLQASEYLFESTDEFVRMSLNENIISKDSFYYSGQQADIVNSNFMNVIIRMSSVLDIITKLIFEVCNIPTDFNRFIKLRSGKIYFKNIRNFKNTFENLSNYKDSLVDTSYKFQELINIRNSIIHNTFLTARPQINYKLIIEDEKELYRSFIYLWDIDEEGKAKRWLNRSRFYSNKTCIQKYLISQIKTFSHVIDQTVLLLKEYLSM